MQVSYQFAADIDSVKFLPALTKAAQTLQISLIKSTSDVADFYFTSEPEVIPETTGLKIAFSEVRGADLVLPVKELSVTEAVILLSWMKERLTFKVVSPLRHDLANVIVILLSRIMRMKSKKEDDHIAELEKIHGRFTDLYRKFNDLEIPRY